ncbi:MAG: carbohydrate-binding family 9-like protein [Candidatus Firestonebacteria bacterium]
MKIVKVMLCVLLAAFIFAEEKIINCAKISEAPVLDGEINEAVWQKCESVTGFLYNFEEEISKNQLEGKFKDMQGKPALQQTTAWVCYDDKNLYLAFKCEEPNPAKMKAGAQGQDDVIWQDDCVEFFLDSENTKTSYYHIILNSQGVPYDHYVKSVKKGKKNQVALDKNIRWNTEGEIKAFVGDTFWSVEASLPLASFKLTPKAGQKCGVNFAREQYTNEEYPNSFSLWAPLTGTFHQPDKFGTLIFK